MIKLSQLISWLVSVPKKKCGSSRGKTILFISSNNWAKYLSRLATDPQYQFQSLSLNTKELLSFKGIFYFIRSTHIVRVGLPPLIPNAKNLALDFVLFAFKIFFAANSRQFCYWIGSDVLFCKKSVGPINGLLRQKLYSSINHISGAPWLTEELSVIGITSKPLIFPYEIKERSPNWPENKLHISWYLPDNDPISYGRLHLEAIVRAFPEIIVNVYGSDRYWENGNRPLNLRLHGWLDDPILLIRRCQIHARIIKHDSLGGSVRDALSSASHVMYTYSLPFCSLAHYSDVSNTLSLVNTFYCQFLNRRLEPNYDGQSWIMKNLSTSSLADKFFQFVQDQ